MKYSNPLQTVLLTVALFAAPVIASAAQKSPVGNKVSNFTLKDFRGAEHSLSGYSQDKAVVVAVLGTECPLAKLYGVRLAELQKKYGPQKVAFVGLNANVQDSITEIAAYARTHKIEFPILKDLGNRVVDELGAVRTPEVFLLDQKRVIRYHGRIDDQYGVGYIRDEPTRHDLTLALDQLLAGKEVESPQTESVGCHIGRVQHPKEDATVTFSNQIARILQKRCMECHREGEIAPFSLSDYEEVVGWAEMIKEVVSKGRMPPWHADPTHRHFANDRSMPLEEKQLIYQWVADGAPLGDIKQLPAPRKFVEGWQLPREPDLILDVSEEPFEVKAEGEVRYQWFSKETNLKEDKWLQAAQILPGNRAVVHHILAFTRQPGERRRGGGDGFLVAYVPGLRPRPFPKGMAKRIPAGSELVFQVHYTPIGSIQFDQSKIGLIFADPDEVTHEVRTTQAANASFKILPGASNQEVKATSAPAPRELLLLSMMPHMHLRGKSFEYQAWLPGDKKETLLDIPAYDFNWQTSYRLDEPLVLPKGSRIRCVAHFDNSDRNLNNPDSTKTVRWGDQTWDEMMIGYFDIAWPIDSKANGQSLPANLGGGGDPRSAAERLIATLDKNDDGKLARDEVERRLLVFFVLIDKDKDRVVTLEEMTAAIKKQRERESRRKKRRE